MWQKTESKISSKQIAFSYRPTSTHWDDDPSLSPDGRHLAFTSTRSGTLELWVSGSDGSAPHQVTSFNKGLISRPTWSPDGKFIAFNTAPTDHQEIYVAELDGGNLKRLDSGFENAFVSDWSKNGRWLYLSAEQTGQWNIWRFDLEGLSDSTAVHVVAHNAIRGYESTDGYFYYSRPYQAGLWRFSLAEIENEKRPAGEDQPWLPDLPPVGLWNNWTVCRDRVFLLTTEGKESSISRWDPDSRRLVDGVNLPGLGSSAVTLSRDCKTCYFVRTEREHGDLMLVEGFK